MPEYNISSTVAAENKQTDYSVNTESTDGASNQKETRSMNENWTQWFAYYKKIPELKAVIDAKATWTVGKGFTSDSETTTILNDIRGWGKDTFNTIIENMIRTYNIGGDAYCEVVRDNEEGEVINLKPLDPETMVHITNAQGIIIRYEQISKVVGKRPKKFTTDRMFHLARNRVADEVHGQSITEALVEIILMKNEAMADYKKVMHRYVQPQWKFKLKTDDPAEIAAYKLKQDAATATGDNIYEPFDVSESELLAVAPNATLSPLAWIESLDAKFYEAAGVPKVVLGGTGAFTEQANTMIYLAYQQNIEKEQLFIEEQLLAQLGITINLEFPASVENNLLSDKEKDGEVNIDPSETTAGQTPVEQTGGKT